MGGVTIKQEQILGYVLPGIGMIMTLIRLAIRKRSSRLGLDDLAIGIASIAQINLMIATNLYTDLSLSSAGWQKVRFFYWTAESFYIIIWASRLSILLSIQRIVPSFKWVRFCTFAAFLFLAIWTALTIQLFVTCETKHGWKELPLPQCPLGKSVAYTMLAMDIIGDGTIILLPIFFISRTTLPFQKRVGLISAFAVSILTSIVGFSHVHYILAGPPLVENLNGILQSSISVIATNLPVIVFKGMSLARKDHTNLDEEAQLDEKTLMERTNAKGDMSTVAGPTLSYGGDYKKDNDSDMKESA